jgi:hypothetical protein
MLPNSYDDYGRCGRSRIGVKYPRSESEARKIVDELSEQICQLERRNHMGMDMDMAMPKTQIVYRDSAPPVIPTNKKLKLINK